MFRHRLVFAAFALGLAACTPLALPADALPTLAPSATPIVPTATPLPPKPSPMPEELVNLAPAAQAALDYLAQQTQRPVADFTVTLVEAVDWSDSCLGIAGPGEACLMVITPGYRIVAQDKTMQYELHTNADGTVVRLGEPEPLPATVLLTWQRTGGIAGVCQRLTVDSTGYYELRECDALNTLFGAGQLPEKEWTWLQEKAGNTAAFTWDTPIPEGAADMFADHLEFMGEGPMTMELAQAETFSNNISQWWATLPRTAPDFTRSGVTGLAQISPTCPGPTRIDAPECAPAPYPALFEIFAAGDRLAALGTVQLGADGQFRIALVPGEYVLVPVLAKRFPTAGEVTIKVAEGEFVEAVLEYDSGMR